MLIAGQYEVEIILRYSDDINSDRLIYRRYSDFEWLHKELLDKNPGCKIIDIPEKNVWCNLKVNNNESLEIRRKQIENYLNYINKHLYLMKNISFKEFLSYNYNSENNPKKSILDNLYNQMPTIFKTQKKSPSGQIFDIFV